MRRNIYALLLAFILGFFAAPLFGQTPAHCPACAVCPKCGQRHGYQPPTVAQITPQRPQFSNDGLDVLNQQRAARGLGALVPDAGLMAGALTKATTAARRNFKGHLGGSMYGANKEGVGWTSGSKSFNSCYAYSAPAGTTAGGALVRGSGGWYSCLLIQHSGYLPSGASGGPFRSIVPRGGGFLRRFRR